MKLNILDWNIGLYGKNNTDPEKSIGYVQEFLNSENSVAVLQELTDINLRFPNDSYNIVFNKIKASFFTAIISKNVNLDIIKQAEIKGIGINRFSCATAKDKYNILGLHLHGGDDNKKELEQFKSSEFDNFDIITGDFNAGIYCTNLNKEFENSDIFRQIFPKHVCICNLPTKKCSDRKTCIDHVFIKNTIVSKCCDFRIHEDIDYSDHYPITFSIDI